MHIEYSAQREDFDGTYEGLIQAALKLGPKGRHPHGFCVYLEPAHDLIRVYWNEWMDSYRASHVVSLEPLRLPHRRIAIEETDLLSVHPDRGKVCISGGKDGRRGGSRVLVGVSRRKRR